MISLGLHLENSKGKRAHIGDEVKLDLLVPSIKDKDHTYRITNILSDGIVEFDGHIGQHINGINDFRIVSRERR